VPLSHTERPARRVGRPRANDKARGKDPRHDILVAAARLFSERGYEGTPLSLIAEAAGLKNSSIYYYFGNKEEIEEALALYTMNDFGPEASAESTGGPAAVSLFRFLLDHVGRVTSGPYDLWYQVQMTTRPRSGLRSARYEAWRGHIRTLVERGIQQGDFRAVDPDFALHMIVGCVYGAIELRHNQNAAAPLETADLIIRGLAVDSTCAAEIRAAGAPRDPAEPRAT
jgi:AcrR family transcriptional regulator